MTKRYLVPILIIAAAPASAHVMPGAHDSLAAGIAHPLLGPDHLAAMMAVGLWAAILGRAARWALPASFVAGMLGGFMAAMGGVGLPMVEPAILASVIILGLMVAVATRLDTRIAATLVFAMGAFHGQAHGSELGTSTALTFAISMLLSTAILHAAGVGIGTGLLSRLRGGSGQRVLAVLGIATAGAGLALALA